MSKNNQFNRNNQPNNPPKDTPREETKETLDTNPNNPTPETVEVQDKVATDNPVVETSKDTATETSSDEVVTSSTAADEVQPDSKESPESQPAPIKPSGDKPQKVFPGQRVQPPVRHLETDTINQQSLESLRSIKNVNMQALVESLDRLERRLSARTIISMDEFAKSMQALHNTLLNVLNTDKTQAEFREQWNYVLKFFKEKETQGLGLHRLYMGVAYWHKSQDDYMHYQALTNFIWVANNVKKDLWRRNVNAGRLFNTSLVTDAGRGRLMNFYPEIF